MNNGQIIFKSERLEAHLLTKKNQNLCCSCCHFLFSNFDENLVSADTKRGRFHGAVGTE